MSFCCGCSVAVFIRLRLPSPTPDSDSRLWLRCLSFFLLQLSTPTASPLAKWINVLLFYLLLHKRKQIYIKQAFENEIFYKIEVKKKQVNRLSFFGPSIFFCVQLMTPTRTFYFRWVGLPTPNLMFQFFDYFRLPSPTTTSPSQS